ncbi:MAG TPA: response regulator [Candidatus Wildermuthbacteria bacterium]|nr:response regulator [Candidatus Wildermuthbacteria bacterium]
MMPKILLIEDDPLLIDIYTTKFKEYDFEVQVEDDGERVIEQVKKFKPDLMVLDIVLPHMAGIFFGKSRVTRSFAKQKL